MLVTPIPRLAQNKLAGIGVVAYIQPVQGLLESRRPGNGQTRRPRVHTGDQDVDDAIRLLCEIPGRSTPLQTPEEVQSVGDDQSFVQADLRLGERLSHTVGGRDTIAIDEDDVQPWLSLGNDRLVDVGQAAGKRAASPTTPHHCDTGSRTPMVQLVVQVVATGLLTRLYLLRRRSLCLLTIVIVNLDPIFSSANSIFSTRA